MKLSYALTLVGLGVSATALCFAQGCSSSSSGSPVTPTDGGNNTDAATSTAGQPPAPSGSKTTSTKEENYAVQTLFLGDTDRSGAASSTAWESFGYNIDGLVTTATSTNVCTLQSGAPLSTQADGNNGIDNSFGENILPILITTAGSDAAAKINAAIAAGSFTVMFDVTGFDDSAAQTATGLTGFLNAGANFGLANDGGVPTFTTADNWPVTQSLLSDPTNPRSSTVTFPSAYIVNGTFVNGTPGDVTLSLEIGGVSLSLDVQHATITFDHKAAGQSTNGTIAGVLNTQALIAQLMTVAGRISSSLCSGSAFASIAAQIEQASDILSNGTNVAGQACDGISIGLGFTGAQIGLPTTVGALAAPTPNPCDTDGGTDGGTD